MLEYYRGTLFLTTNRLSVFDVAFQSRIHLTLHYSELNHASRRNVWALLLQRVQNVSIASEELDTVAKEPINGRQIKNAVKAAQLLAADEGTALSLNHINVVLRIMRNAQNPESRQTLISRFRGRLRYFCRSMGTELLSRSTISGKI